MQSCWCLECFRSRNRRSVSLSWTRICWSNLWTQGVFTRFCHTCHYCDTYRIWLCLWFLYTFYVYVCPVTNRKRATDSTIIENNYIPLSSTVVLPNKHVINLLFCNRVECRMKWSPRAECGDKKTAGMPDLSRMILLWYAGNQSNRPTERQIVAGY
jgi:hypothetical protein